MLQFPSLTAQVYLRQFCILSLPLADRVLCFRTDCLGAGVRADVKWQVEFVQVGFLKFEKSHVAGVCGAVLGAGREERVQRVSARPEAGSAGVDARRQPLVDVNSGMSWLDSQVRQHGTAAVDVVVTHRVCFSVYAEVRFSGGTAITRLNWNV